MTIAEVTTRKDGSPWRAAKVMIEGAIREQGMKDDARCADAGKRHYRERLSFEEALAEARLQKIVGRVLAS